MDDLMNRLQAALTTDHPLLDLQPLFPTERDDGMNPYRSKLRDVLLERKDMLRNKMSHVQLFEEEEPSPDIEEILAQFTNPTFPLEEINTEKDEEWQPLERKYLDGVNNIKNDLMMKQMQLDKDMESAMMHLEQVLKKHRNYRPIDEKDYTSSKQCISKRFEHAKQNLRGEAATKILVLRREIEQQGRKRRNFDKNTTDTLQNWFYEHRLNPYPSDQQKAELAKQCNIKISQVNNWFGNQRIRSKQQALRMQEEEDRERQRQEEEANSAAATVAAVAASQMIVDPMTGGTMNVHSLLPHMQTIVIPASINTNLIANQNGFLQQQNYFQTGQIPQTDNGNGQQFYPEYDATFGLHPSDGEQHFNTMYLG